MTQEQATKVMEQAVMLAIKGVQNINDAKLIIAAWETIKKELADDREGQGD